VSAPAQDRRPSRVADAAHLVALATGVLAAAGGIALLAGAAPLLGRGALVVAIGGSILGATLAAVGLTATHDAADPAGRRRAWRAGILSVTLLILLVAAFQLRLGGPVVTAAEAGAGGAAEPAATPGGLSAAELERMHEEQPGLVPIAVDEPVAEAFRRAERTAEALGWTAASRDAERHRLELRAEGRPDIRVRVRAAPQGSVILVHPTSRDDLDEGAGLVRAFADRVNRD
jgi:hypothetical protein